MYRIMIILLVILFVSVSASAQEMIMYGKVEQIEKRSITVDGKKFPIQKGWGEGEDSGEPRGSGQG